MLITVDGIVIGNRSIGENSSFVDILTSEYGVIEVVAHGVKKLTGSNSSSVSLFSYATFCMNKSGIKYTLNSSSSKYTFYKLSQDIGALSLAVYFSDLVKYTTASEQANPDLLRFFAISLYELEKMTKPLVQIKAVFELRLAAYIGLVPDLRACAECACYENEIMYFDFERKCIVCGDCFSQSESFNNNVVKLNPTLLYTMRYIVFSELKKIYAFSISDENAENLSEICEEYIIMELNRGFKSLDYFKSLF